MSFPSDQLNNAFQKLEVSKPLDKKKDEYLKNIRSQKRKIHLQNKRITAAVSLSSQLENMHIQEKDTLGEGLSIQEFIAECQGRTYTLEQISELVASIYSPNPYRQYFGVIGIRKLLAIELPPIQLLIEADILPQLVEFLGREDEHHLQIEAAWALTNLASGTTEQTGQVVENEAIPALIKLLRSPHKEVRAQAIWTLGNIAGDNIDFRDIIIEGGLVEPLVKTLKGALSEGDKQMIKDGIWALSNLCRGNPIPPFEDLKDALPVFTQVIMSQEDPQILQDALWALSYLADEGEAGIQQVLDSEVVPFILKHMEGSWSGLLCPCIRIVGSLFAGNNKQVDSVLAVPGVLEKLFNALRNPLKMPRREAAWAFSNLAAGAPEHIECIVGNSEYLNQLISMGLSDEIEVRRQIAWTFANVLNSASEEQLRTLLEKRKIIEFFGKIIEDDEDVETQEVALKGVWMIVNLKGWGSPKGFLEDYCRPLLEENKIIEKIEKLQNHPSSGIYEMVMKILEHVNNADKVSD